MEFQFENLTIKNLPLDDIENLQKLFEGSKDYSMLIEGRLPRPNDAQDLLRALPDGKSLKDKFVLGVYKENILAGAIDLIKDYPEQDIWFIGLLLLSPEYRNKGLGSKIYRKLREELIILGKTKAIRISVAEQNSNALNFWRKLGFIEIYSKLQTREGNEVKFIYLEDKF
jgi:ribosomal protein S18 acetylase RimI-like enzyme